MKFNAEFIELVDLKNVMMALTLNWRAFRRIKEVVYNYNIFNTINITAVNQLNVQLNHTRKNN